MALALISLPLSSSAANLPPPEVGAAAAAGGLVVFRPSTEGELCAFALAEATVGAEGRARGGAG